MALLVLFSTVSFTVEKNFCGDVLVDVSVFTEAQKCCVEAPELEQAAITKMSCCESTVDVVQGQNNMIVKTFDDFDFEQQVFITTLGYAYLNLFEDFSKQIIPYKNYSPPNLVKNIQVRDQVFII